MIRYIKHIEIDKAKWDECISSSSNGIIYAYSWYLDQACPGWDALIENEYESVFPLTKGKKYGIEYLYPPFFTQQLGLFSINKISEKLLNLFLSNIPEQFKFIEINLNSENNFLADGFIQKKNLTHHLNLNAPYENIYKNYSENLQRNLKKATKFNQSIIREIAAEKIVKLFRENRGKEIKKLNSSHYLSFLNILNAAKRRSCLKIYGVENEEKELIAGAFFMESNGKSIFIFSGSNTEAKEKFSIPLLINTYIKVHSGLNLLLDFEGSNDLNLARFYKSFGTGEVVYLQIKKNNLPLPFKLFKK